MPKRNWIFSLVAIAATWPLGLPALSQALLPYRIDLNVQNLEDQGLSMLQDAVQLTRFEQYELAFPLAKLAAQLVPKDFRAWFLLGSLYLQEQDYPAAVAALERARDLIPSHNVQERTGVFFMLGSAYFQTEQYFEAKQVFRLGLRENQESVEAWFDLGNTYYMLQEYEDAIAAYQTAMELSDEFWPAINNIGLVKYEQGKPDAAIQAWEAALKIDHSAAEPMLAIAVARYRQSRSPESVRLGKMALSLDPAYGDLDFLRLNLWGDRLMEDAIQFLAVPAIRAQLGRSNSAAHP
ncbi:MAG: tetratricopeptide repeat protein [Spirulina sp. DLM2.Bin59]|nr:MAG: tetratricopeptide repeat protein [Spirulina sp. DLM2.Bin59]